MASLENTCDTLHMTVLNLDRDSSLQLLHELNQSIKDSGVFHSLVRGLIQHPDLTAEGASLVYLLANHGADVNQADQNGLSPLLAYMVQCKSPAARIVEAFFRVGAHVTSNKEMDRVRPGLLKRKLISDEIRQMFLDFMPGIWEAVAADDAMSVRRLLNQWCNIKVTKNGMSVVELAFSKGTEDIIRVITGIGLSMDLAHGVLSGDVKFVEKILQSGSRININLKNLSDKGVTPLYYAMCQNNVAMVDLLIKHGARLDASVQIESEVEMSLYLYALSPASPCIHIDLLKHTIPTSPISVDQLYYMGKNAIFCGIDFQIDTDLFEEILQKSSAHVLTQRIQVDEFMLDAREYALYCSQPELAARIDQVAYGWYFHSGDKKNRNILAQHGFRVRENCSENGFQEDADNFARCLTEYESYKQGFVEAVVAGAEGEVKERLYADCLTDMGLEMCMADCRLQGDGQPMLHKAVLRRDVDTTKLLVEAIVYVNKQKLDSLRDQCFRTALHYAYGMGDGRQLIDILEDHGASAFAMDKDGRSPIGFKDRREQTEMADLLEYQLIQDFRNPEPDPWSVPLPMPIMGYLTKCVHEHHAKKAKSLLNNGQNHNNAMLSYDAGQDVRHQTSETNTLVNTSSRTQHTQYNRSNTAHGEVSSQDKAKTATGSQSKLHLETNQTINTAPGNQYDLVDRSLIGSLTYSAGDTTNSQYSQIVPDHSHSYTTQGSDGVCQFHDIIPTRYCNHVDKGTSTANNGASKSQYTQAFKNKAHGHTEHHRLEHETIYRSVSDNTLNSRSQPPTHRSGNVDCEAGDNQSDSSSNSDNDQSDVSDYPAGQSDGEYDGDDSAEESDSEAKSPANTCAIL